MRFDADQKESCHETTDDVRTGLIKLDSIKVLPDRVELLVRVLSLEKRQATPELIDACLKAYPSLPDHTCRNKKGPFFGDVMYGTSIPHLLEHLIIDIQTRMLARSRLDDVSCSDVVSRSDDALRANVVFTGTTQFFPDDLLLAQVRVSFIDDLMVLSAIKEAVDFINSLSLE